MSKVHITDTVLRDAHQSLLATRMRTEDMLPICSKLDAIGYWSLEMWGGATFDACIRFLKEDPWERLREALPNTRLQMLLRGQNLLGYRHYSDDVVRAFVKSAAENGIDVFRIFDALNDVRNLQVSIEAVKESNKHAQGAISYTISPVYIRIPLRDWPACASSRPLKTVVGTSTQPAPLFPVAPAIHPRKAWWPPCAIPNMTPDSICRPCRKLVFTFMRSEKNITSLKVNLPASTPAYKTIKCRAE